MANPINPANREAQQPDTTAFTCQMLTSEYAKYAPTTNTAPSDKFKKRHVR
jgi:hypothetical protein